MAELDAPTAEWKEALRRVRAAWEALDAAERNSAAAVCSAAGREALLAGARDFLAAAQSPRLRSFARMLAPGADSRAVLCALVPLERVDARTRVTDADMGITDSDPASGARGAGGAAAASAAPVPLVAVADNIRSALNAGGLLRTAAFFGAEAMWSCGYTAGPEHPQVARSALGAERIVAVRRFADVREAVAQARAEGRAVYALETSVSAVPVESFDFRFPCALLLGSERFGLDPDVVAAADACLCIPGGGAKNSLNVVSAFAVAMHCAATDFRRGAD